jgi:lantibiotic biosynthesis protein
MENKTQTRVAFEEQISLVAGELIGLKNQIPTFGLNSGKLSVALFYCYLSDYQKDEKYLTIAGDVLDECFEEMSPKLYKGHNYFLELSELGVFLEFAKKNNWYSADTEQFLESIDKHLYEYMKKKIVLKNLDVYAGALMAGSYYLNRKTESILVEEYLRELVFAIDNLKLLDELGGYFWQSPIFNDDRVYTGISHGSAMIINFLCGVHQKGMELQLCEDLIYKACLFLQNIKGKDARKALYPNIIGEKLGAIQLSFCYGDLGTSYVLLRASQVLNSEELHQEILNDLHDLGQLTDSASTSINDAGITYGAVGVATIFNKIAELEKNPIFESYANFWYEKIPNFRTHNDPTIGYQAQFNQYNPATNIAFSEGIAGIGIAMMCFLNKKLPPIYELIGLR